MNKSDIIENLYKNNKFHSKKDIEDSIVLLIDSLTKALSDGDRVELRGFGTFSTRKRETRIARNPKTGTAIKVNSKYHPYFRAAKSLKTRLKD
tara:strand:+ start:3810 stop:4088 length:279 start_codon:yes stop_codon:yes gene_type:complete